MDDIRSKVLSIVQLNGPVLPVRISKLINQDILFTSAILSELTDRNQILLSKAKIGGSPVYYIRGQEEKLQMLYNYLGDMHKKAYNLLKEKRLLKDSECEPWQRVALRELKDFAIQFNFNNEIFWRWYLLNEENAIKILQPVKQEIIKEESKKEILEEIKEEEKLLEKVSSKEEKIPLKKEKLKIKREVSIEILRRIEKYFKINNIEIINEKIIKKNIEINYNLRVDSPIGKVIFFCKINIKKKISDGDLSLALNEAKNKQTLFLSNGDLTKRAKEFLEKEKENIIFKKI